MKRERRYLVLKLDDVEKYLSDSNKKYLEAFCNKISMRREQDNKKPNKNYVVVGEDWPMYEDTWNSIAKWVDENENISV